MIITPIIIIIFNIIPNLNIAVAFFLSFNIFIISFIISLLLPSREGYVFSGIGLFVCWLLCLSVNNITQKVIDRF